MTDPRPREIKYNNSKTTVSLILLCMSSDANIHPVSNCIGIGATTDSTTEGDVETTSTMVGSCRLHIAEFV